MKQERAMVIVGAGEAGTAAAIALRQGGWPGRVILIGSEATLPYERPPLSKGLLTEGEDSGPKFLITAQRLSELAIEYLAGVNVLSIDRSAHTVSLQGGELLSYDRLLLATGARPRMLGVPVDPECRMATLRTYADAVAIRQTLRPGCGVVVIGGGFIGLEVAASAVSRGASVTVLEAGPRLLMRAVPASIAERIKAKHLDAGVRIELDATVAGIEAVEEQSLVSLADGRTFLADLVLVGVGAVPNVELAQTAGLTIEKGIAASDTLATSDPDIFTAGDCCSFLHRLYGERVRLEVWRNAWQQGAVAAANMLGSGSTYEVVPWFWSDQYDETLQIAGIYSNSDAAINRDLGDKGQISFYLAPDGRLVAACGFGSLATISKDIRIAETMIGRRIRPDADALANPAIAIKSLAI
ncbi:ferredoxin reductase [Mesorhizobium erdmanii]|uniref:Ferredoxin reductase n=2 Tax=Mesorhizobium TaxID=68287 RepID=A0A3M9X084_9HYPH|nr:MULTISPECIES: FAD-dependent oxidoreductase [Mesorhizobium]RNJ41172.1 ferredoxin reductase [Mesorhizobium japonicum]RXT39476.1 ferredoxin reductase [Mesorhizobium erdmanii]